jgi:uroporphyrinogen-III synthase
VSALESQGGTVIPVEVYEYGALADPSSVTNLIRKIANRDIQVLAFTSAPQVRIFFDIASQLGLSAELEKALKNGVIVASIGDVTNRALKENGVVAKIVPKQPRMGAMAQAVAEFFGKRGKMGDIGTHPEF